jgi:hypothetical protein
MEGINTTTFAEITSRERLVSVDLETKRFKQICDYTPGVDGYDNVVPKDGHLPDKGPDGFH